ncbi:MAG: hypothetical protein JST42_06915 [Bacteroidetes bacterium]|nr:hypothetical protein [Bacteroidota bacterium]
MTPPVRSLPPIAISAVGTLNVTDYNARRIRKVTEGQVSLVPVVRHVHIPLFVEKDRIGIHHRYADGDGPTAKFNYPAGLAIDADGSLYVADAMNNRVRKISYK